MRVGFIGTGSMGGILIDAFVEAGSIPPANIHASNRTFTKVKELAKKHTGLHAYPTNRRVVEQAELVFLCVKPLEFKHVLDEIAPYVKPEQIVVSITSPVQISDLEKFLSAKIAKIIPSITNAAQSGASLMIAGSRLTETDRNMLYDLMKTISHPLWIDENFTRVSSDIVSCGPAFISYLLQELIDAAVRVTNLPREQAVYLTTSMMIGLGRLFESEKFTLQTLQQRVCVPGGVTGEGLNILQQEVNDMFDKMFKQTQYKFREDLDAVQNMFYKEMK